MRRRAFQRVKLPAAAAIVAVWLAVSASAQPNRVSDREVKAIFLFNFAQFVDWPPSAFEGPLAPIVIGVIGDDPFDGTLDELVKGEVVKNRSLIVTRFKNVDQLSACHILFVSASETQRYERILTTMRGRPTLTVGETDGFATRGGMVRFVTERNRVGLQVNVKAARSAGLTISSNLLRPARIVDGGN
jgi:hypothetical protein